MESPSETFGWNFRSSFLLHSSLSNSNSFRGWECHCCDRIQSVGIVGSAHPRVPKSFGGKGRVCIEPQHSGGSLYALAVTDNLVGVSGSNRMVREHSPSWQQIQVFDLRRGTVKGNWTNVLKYEIVSLHFSSQSNDICFAGGVDSGVMWISNSHDSWHADRGQVEEISFGICWQTLVGWDCKSCLRKIFLWELLSKKEFTSFLILQFIPRPTFPDKQVVNELKVVFRGNRLETKKNCPI